MVPWIVSVLLLAMLGPCYGQTDDLTDECSSYTSCDACIAAAIACVWCPDPPPFLGPRCTSPENANCSSVLEDPIALPPKILSNEPLGETVQIAPQKLRLNLRTGEPQTFTLSVKPARNYPLDMYFLMDLSGSQEQDLEMLRSLSKSITNELENISSQFALGFGSFVDKIAYPYASILQNGLDYMENHLSLKKQCATGRSECFPTYTYRHQLSLTNDSSQFTDVLLNTTIRANLDPPEATLEALLQAVICPDDVGWRNDSLRMVMVLTDAGFKTALDGKVAALITPNDGECHLQRSEEGDFYEYVQDPEQDFPSIYQVRQKLVENDIVTIFAVDAPNREILSLLAQELGSSRAFVQEIQDDSSDIVSVIRQAYESVTRDVVVEGIAGLNIAVTPVFNCNLTNDAMGCANVTVEERVRFNVTVTMQQCLREYKDVDLSLPGFGSVTLALMPICECNCSSQSDTTPDRESCNGKGSLVCGTCDCTDGSFGDQCECNQRLGSCPNDCFNRGTCDRCTRICSCDTMANDMGVILGSYGESCQCDNTTSSSRACPTGRDNQLICSGRGECICGTKPCGCDCKCSSAAPLSGEPYFGDGTALDCGCDPDNCYNQDEKYAGRLCAHSRDAGKNGMCTCEGCECPMSNTVPFNKTCIHTDDLCAMFESCASCGVNCTTLDNCSPGSLDDSVGGVLCQFDQSDCIVDYEVVLSGEFNTMGMVFVGQERDCQSSSLGDLPWIIAVSIVAGVLVLGVLLLIIAKIILMIIDRREYKKFLNEMHTGDFVPHSNPLYVMPDVKYKNPARNRKLEKVPEDDPDD